MMKSSGDSVFGAMAAQTASAAMASAADDLVMRQYLLERRPKESAQTEELDLPSIQSGSDDLAAQRQALHDNEGIVSQAVSLDEDDDLDGDDDLFAQFRMRRMAEWKQAKEKFLAEQQHGHGDYVEIVQDEFLPTVTKSTQVVCHFYHRDFERCKIIDKHLAVISDKHRATRFVKINAEKTPFFVDKLQIRVLPTLIVFKDGIAVDRVVGFEELGARDDFQTAMLVKRLFKAGAIDSKSLQEKFGRQSAAKRAGDNAGNDDF